MIPELRDLCYEERQKECGLTTIETKRLTGDQVFLRYSMGMKILVEIFVLTQER